MEQARPGTALVGCAGWSIPRPQAAYFPPAGSQLERYARLFGAVEINSSFYRPHRPGTYARWAGSVPPAFRFSLKLPRHMSHELRLQGIEEPLAQFASDVAALGERLGCVLVQLPPSLVFDTGIAAGACAALRRRFDCMLACEARHPSWFGAEATVLLQAHGITRVIADPAKGQPGAHEPTTASIYARLHGSPRVYYSSYSDAYLAALAEDLRLHALAQRPVWLIFDNTASGAAMANALQLRYP